MKKGKLIIFEGTDYSGKSTCINQIQRHLLRIDHKFVNTFEPGNGFEQGEHIGVCNEIRRVLLSTKTKPKLEALLFSASRYYHTLDMINYLNEGYDVICDRYFLSSLAYQGLSCGFNYIHACNKHALDLLNGYEVYNIVLTLDYNTYKKRSSYREQDAMEDVSVNKIKSRIENMKDAKTILKRLDMNEWVANTYFIDATQDKQSQIKECTDLVLNILNK